MQCWILSCYVFFGNVSVNMFFKLVHLNFKGLTWKTHAFLRTNYYVVVTIWVGSELKHIAFLLCPCEQSDYENSSPYNYILNGKKILASADTQK